MFTYVIVHIFKFAEARFQIDAFVKQFELSSSVAELCSIRFAKVRVDVAGDYTDVALHIATVFVSVHMFAVFIVVVRAAEIIQ